MFLRTVIGLSRSLRDPSVTPYLDVDTNFLTVVCLSRRRRRRDIRWVEVRDLRQFESILSHGGEGIGHILFK